MNHFTVKQVRDVVERFERTRLGEQLFRVARLAAVGVAMAYATHSTLDTVSVMAIVEAAFRQVFPA